jgi:ABC-2 type transport system ATP-binding protein
MAILETEDLTRRFGGFVAVDRLTIRVEAGEVFGLLGANGAGKTVTMKMLTTLLPPSSGRARIAGLDVRTRAADVRRVIGYVPQMISADGALTGYENLLIFAKLYDIPRRERAVRVANALAFMDLDEVAHKLVRDYSGGMIRRLEIAQSTLHRPAVLFLDEPTIGLDPVARAAVWDHVERLQREYGITIILTTHLMEEVEGLCGRVAILHRGRVMVIGAPDALKAEIGSAGATMDDVFARYAEDAVEAGSGYRDTARTRRIARRLG